MKKIKSFLLTVFSTMITGVSVGIFLTPNKIVSGGASGIATILFHTLSIPPGVTFIVANIIFLIPATMILGKKFAVKTLISAALLSFFVQVGSYFPFYTQNTTLSTIFGGAIYGVGIGISFAAGASTGGTAILGRLIQLRFPSVAIGKILMVLDGIIILTAFIIFGEIELTLLGILALIIASWAVDFVIGQLNTSKIAFVISSQGETIAKKLVATSHRGVTVIDVKGAYTSTPKKMLFCALKEGETVSFQQKILDIDENAFIVFSKSQRIKGNGFLLYK